MSEVIILCGPPCSGKSTLAKQLAEECDYDVVSRDHIRKVIFNLKRYADYQFSKQNEQEVSDCQKATLQWLIQEGRDIVVDNTHCQEKYLTELIEYFQPTGYTIKVIFFDIPLWLLYIRNWIRTRKEDKHIPPHVIKTMHSNFKKINKIRYGNTVKKTIWGQTKSLFTEGLFHF